MRIAHVAFALALVACKSNDGAPDAGPLSVPAPPPPSPGSDDARERLSTSIGSGRALDREVVPANTEWRGWSAVDDRIAAAYGDVDGAPLALITADGGGTWRVVRGERGGASRWALSDSGMVALLTGLEEGPAAQRTLGSLRVHVVDGGTALGPPSLVLPAEGGKKPRLSPDTLLAAFAGPDTLAVLAVEPVGPALVYAPGSPHAPPAPPQPLPAKEKPLPGVYGRPAQLVSVRGRELVVRPAPTQGQPVAEPVVVEGFTPSPTLPRDVSGAPICISGKWTHRWIAQPRGRDFVLSISPDKAGAIPIATPRVTSVSQPTNASERAFGCAADSVTVEIRGGGEGRPLTCQVGGECVAPEEPPFRPWPTAHARRMHVTPTPRGVIAVVSRSEGPRWGSWLAQSTDSGKTWQLPRVIAEGDVERGRVEVGLLATVGGRALMLLRSDVSGTTQRAWFVLASDDGGATWVAP